ncbi:MAG: formylglycine-generating enzyme family protein [Cyanobacteria bacterium J06626_14]
MPEKLMSALDVPNSLIPSGQSAQGNRVIALLQRVKSPGGCGLMELLKTLDAIAPLPFGVSLERKPAQEPSTENYREKLPHGVHLEMVYIPEGIFLMGSPENEADRYKDEGPQHRVAVPAFYMGKYPVTQKEWFIVSTFPQVERKLESEPSHFKGDDLPVEMVSWHDAVEFCKRLSKHTRQNYRLPSEAEWEYACRARTTTAYSFGDFITAEQANFVVNVGKTTPVGKYRPNTFGLYDMHGSVWEWCLDHWHENYDGAPADGSAWVSGGDSDSRVIRGGSWAYAPRNCRSAYRYFNNRDNRNRFIGFRVVCAVQ